MSHATRFRPGERPVRGADWELVSLLGVGGFGEVWRRRNHALPGLPHVALKFCFRPEVREALLLHEGRIAQLVAAGAGHPGIVKLLGSHLAADPPCLVYELVEGRDLGAMLEDPASAGGAWRADLLVQIVDAVAFAHRLSPPVVHRDLKPSNVLVVGGERPLCRITDFGIGAAVGGDAKLKTSLVGTYSPDYGSPEQAGGGPTDPRDDVYALGAMWFRMAAGRTFNGKLLEPERSAQFDGLPEAPGRLQLLKACLAARAGDRPADAVELLRRLRSERPPWTRRAALAAMGLATVAGAAGLAAWLPRPKRRPRPVDPGPGQAEGPRPEEPRPEGPPGSAPVEAYPPRVNSLGMRFVRVPPGTFLMGSPEDEPGRSTDEPLHEVAISRAFWLADFPVTQAAFTQVMGRNPSWFKNIPDAPLLPAETLQWPDLGELCRRLAALPEEARHGRRYRLPTEAEWEYACRAGSNLPYHAGRPGRALPEQAANFGFSLNRTSKRGDYPPNALGLYDMHGNVWEYCADWYSAGYYAVSPPSDPPGPADGLFRVKRGGCCLSRAASCRAASRSWDTIGYLGVRLVLEG